VVRCTVEGVAVRAGNAAAAAGNLGAAAQAGNALAVAPLLPGRIALHQCFTFQSPLLDFGWR
jgi:hypothetical protein